MFLEYFAFSRSLFFSLAQLMKVLDPSCIHSWHGIISDGRAGRVGWFGVALLHAGSLYASPLNVESESAQVADFGIIALGLLVALQAFWIVGLLRSRRRLRTSGKEIQYSHNQLQSWLFHAPISISVFKQSGQTVMINERFTQLLGYESSDFRTATDMWNVLIQDEVNRERFLNRWGEQIERPWSNKWEAEEVLVTSKSGRVKALESHVSIIGEYWVCLHNDVTWRNQVQRELENALNQAFQANITKTQFLTNMSHEIRTPLNGVLGMAQLLFETEMDEEQRSFVETIHQSGQTLLMTINDILDLSKMEAGSIGIESVPVDLNQCIKESVALCLPKLKRANVRFNLQIEPDVPLSICGDSVRISQILVNLLSNAFKYTMEGSVMLRVSREGGTADSHYLSISVKDTGIGIPLEKQATIFEPFVQADASNTRQFGGSGLGLTISRHLAARMGGEIRVVSQPESGSEFVFSWTADAVLDSTRPVQTQSDERSPTERLLGHSIRTLVVDDNLVNSKVIELCLKKCGIVPTKASNGQEALSALKKTPYDLVFMDIQMPGMDGLQCTRAIRKELPEESQPFIVALTAHALPDHMEQCRRAGMNGFLSKPYRNEDLRSVIHLYLEHQSGDRKTCYF